MIWQLQLGPGLMQSDVELQPISEHHGLQTAKWMRGSGSQVSNKIHKDQLSVELVFADLFLGRIKYFLDLSVDMPKMQQRSMEPEI